jgi:RNA polymerase sigma-70 factor, ECF subfamily
LPYQYDCTASPVSQAIWKTGGYDVDVSASQRFEDQLTDLLPTLQIWACALTRNGAAADDLVQDVAFKAWAAQDRFVPGTNFKAWLHRIMVNHFISGVRAQREYVSVDAMPDVAVPAEQQSKVDLDQLSGEFQRLPDHLKEALHQIAIEQRSYEDVAATSGCGCWHPEKPGAPGTNSFAGSYGGQPVDRGLTAMHGTIILGQRTKEMPQCSGACWVGSCRGTAMSIGRGVVA